MYTFKKEERLCSKKLISELFSNGSSFLLYPFRITWMNVKEELPYPAQIVISAPKRRFKRAIDRNRIKRLIREAYRKNKEADLYSHLRPAGKFLVILINYVGNDIFTAIEMEKKLILGLKRLQKEYEQSA